MVAYSPQNKYILFVCALFQHITKLPLFIPGRINKYESKPFLLSICTRPLVCPKGSKFIAVVGVLSNFSLKYLLPYSICRIKDSPDSIVQSGLRYQPPIICHFPSATSFCMRPNNSGSYSSIHSYKSASLWLNTNPSNSSQKSAAVRNVEIASAAPSCHFHSHIGSMCALHNKYTFFILFVLSYLLYASKIFSAFFLKSDTVNLPFRL